MTKVSRFAKLLGLLVALSFVSPGPVAEARRRPFKRFFMPKRVARACVQSGSHAQFFRQCCRRGFVRGSATGDGGGTCR